VLKAKQTQEEMEKDELARQKEHERQKGRDKEKLQREQELKSKIGFDEMGINTGTRQKTNPAYILGAIGVVLIIVLVIIFNSNKTAHESYDSGSYSDSATYTTPVQETPTDTAKSSDGTYDANTYDARVDSNKRAE